MVFAKSSNWTRTLGQSLASRGDELGHELVEVLAAHAVLAEPHVERVRQQRLVVRAHVEHHRQARRRMNAGARRVERELADRDAHPARALIAQAEDALAVGHDDHAHVLPRPVAEARRDAAAVRVRDVEAARAPEEVTELLARLPDRGRVHDGHHCFEVFRQHAVEERLVAILQAREVDVTLEVVLLPAVVLEHARDLLLDREDVRRQQALRARARRARLR